MVPRFHLFHIFTAWSSLLSYSVGKFVGSRASVSDSFAGKTILSALFCTDFITSAQLSGIDYHTGIAYSKTGFIVVRYTFRTLAFANTRSTQYP